MKNYLFSLLVFLCLQTQAIQHFQSLNVYPTKHVMSSDSQFAVYSAGNTTQVFNTQKWLLIKDLHLPSLALSLSKNSLYLAVTTFGPKGKYVVLFNTQTWKEIYRQDITSVQRAEISFTPDSQKLSVSGHYMVRFYSVLDGKKTFAYDAPPDQNPTLILSPDYQYLVIKNNYFNKNLTELEVLDTTTGATVFSSAFSKVAYFPNVEFSPKGHFLFISGVFPDPNDSAICLRNIHILETKYWNAAHSMRTSYDCDNLSAAISIVPSADEQLLAVAHSDGFEVLDTNLWKVHFRYPALLRKDDSWSIKFSPSGKYLVAIQNKYLSTSDVFFTETTNWAMTSLDLHEKIDPKYAPAAISADNILFTPQEDRLVMTGYASWRESSLNLNIRWERIYDLTKGINLGNFEESVWSRTPYQPVAPSSFLSLDGKYLFNFDNLTNFSIIDMKTLKEVYTGKGHMYGIRYVDATADGKYLLVGSTFENYSHLEVTQLK